MLNHQLIKVDSVGRLKATLSTPTDFNGGTPTRDGRLCCVEVDGVYFLNGLGYGPEGRVTLEQAVNPPSENPFVNPKGRLRAATEAVPAFWLYGLPFSADGQLCVTFGDTPPPVDTRAYSNAYSTAYD